MQQKWRGRRHPYSPALPPLLLYRPDFPKWPIYKFNFRPLPVESAFKIGRKLNPVESSTDSRTFSIVSVHQEIHIFYQKMKLVSLEERNKTFTSLQISKHFLKVSEKGQLLSLRDAPDSRNFTVVVKSDADRTGKTVSYIFVTKRVSQQCGFLWNDPDCLTWDEENLATLTSVIQ